MGERLAMKANKAIKIIYYVVIGFVALVAVLLVVSVLPITGNFKVMVVQSGSMAPKIKMGSVVVIKPVEEYKIGDVITFGPYSRIKAPITHRISDVKIVNGQPVYITKGDANNSPDQREIQKREIIGKVLFDVPYLGYVVSFAKKPIGFTLIIVVPAGLIIFDETKNIFNELKRKRETDA